MFSKGRKIGKTEHCTIDEKDFINLSTRRNVLSLLTNA